MNNLLDQLYINRNINLLIKITSTTVTSTPGSNIITGTVNAGDSSN